MAAIQAFSGAFGAVSKYEAGKYNQKVFDTNARVAEAQAADATARGIENEKRLRQQISRAIGTTRASYAGQGVEVNEGSSVDAQANIAYMGELDAITIRNNAAREAWGYRVEAYNYTARGKMAKWEGNTGAVSSVLGAISSIYSGGGFGSKS